jgi:hypothetical protein
MSDMHREPGRGPYQPKRARGMPWLLVALAVVAILGLMAWTMRDGSRTASNPMYQTTGQGGPAPAPAPAPAPSR